MAEGEVGESFRVRERVPSVSREHPRPLLYRHGVGRERMLKKSPKREEALDFFGFFLLFFGTKLPKKSIVCFFSFIFSKF